MIIIKRYYPKSNFMRSIVDFYQWTEVTKSTILKTLPNGRVDAWIAYPDDGSFYFSKGCKTYKVGATGFYPLTSKGFEIIIPQKLNCLNIKFYPRVISYKSLMKLQKCEGPISFDDLFDINSFNQLQRSGDEELDIQRLIDAVEIFFEKLFLNNVNNDTWLSDILSKFERSNINDLKISTIATNAFVSSKTLERRFQDQLKINPKTFAKVLRFQNVLLNARNVSKRRDNHDFFFRNAITNNYFDYSHFNKDCKQFCGFTSSKLTKQLVNNTSDLILIN